MPDLHRTVCLAALWAGFAAAAGAQPEYSTAWPQPWMRDPIKLSADRQANDEYPSVARERSGAVWVVWSSCRPKSSRVPADALFG